MQDSSTQETGSFRDCITHPVLQELYDFWLQRRGDRQVMLRRDLDPVDIPQLLKNLILADVGGGGNAIRYRLVGTEIVAAHGMDYTGKTIEELTSGTTLAFTRNLYGVVVRRAVPMFSQGSFRWAGKEHCWTKRLHLPLSRDGEIVDVVLSGQVFESGRTSDRELLRPAAQSELEFDRETLSSPPEGRVSATGNRP